MKPTDGRLRWRCRRGTKELDLLLTRFLDGGYSNLPNKDQDLFGRLLEQQDPELITWLISGEVPTNSEFHDLVVKIRATHRC